MTVYKLQNYKITSQFFLHRNLTFSKEQVWGVNLFIKHFMFKMSGNGNLLLVEKVENMLRNVRYFINFINFY